MDKMKSQHNIQWNLDITNGQETGKICLLYRGFIISRFFSIYFTITGIRKSFVKGLGYLEVHFIELLRICFTRIKIKLTKNSDYALKCH